MPVYSACASVAIYPFIQTIPLKLVPSIQHPNHEPARFMLTAIDRSPARMAAALCLLLWLFTPRPVRCPV